MPSSTDDPWRHEVSRSLGKIEANIDILVKSREDDSGRIKELETKQNKRDGIVAAAILLVPFFTEPIKRLLNIG